MSASVDALISRMSEAERRLAEHADAPVPDGLTDPDPATDERWEAGQVWAHIAEFPPYWLAEAQKVASLPTKRGERSSPCSISAVRSSALNRSRQMSKRKTRAASSR